MTIHERISALRNVMGEKGIDAYIVPTEDPHGSEYVTPHWQCRKWISGFTGSAGTVVVTEDRAGLWTDFRYYIQAQEELKDSGIELFRYGMPGVPSYDQWLADNLKKGATVGMDGRNFSVDSAEKLETFLGKSGIAIKADCPFMDHIWKEGRPSLPSGAIFLHDIKYNGQSRKDKLKSLRASMEKSGASHHLLASLEDICWLFNIRGRDLETIPVVIAYALISMNGAVLFTDERKAEGVRTALSADNVEIKPYDHIAEALASIPSGSVLLADKSRVSVSLIESLSSGVEVTYETNPTTHMKACKNDIEIGNIRKVMEYDGVAKVRFFKWIEENRNIGSHTELSLAAKLREFREMEEEFAGESFTPIPGYRGHGALCHYSAEEVSQYTVDDEGGLFLIDSGGQYLGGTTDITRTITLGNPTKQEIRDYTLVLKGHIALSMAKFPQGTRGYQLDLLARQAMWNEGIDYGHGTGHGVGHYLSVHEGPMNISPKPIDVPLKPGMVISNEPGIYREGSHGIRIENLILVNEERDTEFGKFFNFETLTLCPYEPDLIDPSLLSEEEKTWLNDYNRKVYERLSPLLDEMEKAWLKKRTLDLVL